jgi:DTW domain-containing protein YfiP
VESGGAPLPNFDIDSDTRGRPIVLLPSENSVPLEQYMEEHGSESIKRVILIDSPWKSIGGILRRNPQLSNYDHVRLSGRETLFWRYNSLTNQHLSTIETIHHFISSFDPENNYDDLLW